MDSRKIKESLANNTLKKALGTFGDSYVKERKEVYSDVDFEKLRRDIQRAKDQVVENPDCYISQFIENAEKSGAKVFVAESQDEVFNYLKELITENGVHRIVKSKSMATEELHLNDVLEQFGVDEVVETDLGEWILQLKKDKPSHMVLPSIHLTRSDVADVLNQQLPYTVKDDVNDIVSVARKELRKKFINADMGINGANVLIAESGSYVLFTNEGNGRLTANLPPVQVVIAGIEKLIPRFTDLLPIITALPKSATAQKMISYVTVVSGPLPLQNGTKNLHYILLAGERRKILEDQRFKSVFYCLRCASCLNVCPVFQQVGGHVYGGHTYTGPIGTILTYLLSGLDEAKDIHNFCASCLRCKEVCPAGINIPDLILLIREEVVEKNKSAVLDLLVDGFLKKDTRFNSFMKLGAYAGKVVSPGGNFPLFLTRKFAGQKYIPSISTKPLSDRYIQSSIKKISNNRVLFFPGCLVEYIFPEIGEKIIKFLEKCSYQPILLDKYGCCGGPAHHTGKKNAFIEIARSNFSKIKAIDPDFIVTPCPTCAEVIKKRYGEVLPEAKDYLYQRTFDYCQFVFETGFQNIEPKFDCIATYHDPCHLRRGLGVIDEPRQIIKKLGYQLVEMDEYDACCGMAGAFSLKLPNISEQIMKKKLSKAEKTCAKHLITACPGCLLQLRGGAKALGNDIDVKHLAELVE
ncbi:MAG: LUD domain-containing protein [Syntrophaceticus schinkii]|nr:LUD domain-containing protein [Syntrophaceticus schinkii]